MSDEMDLDSCPHKGGFVFGTHIPDTSWRPTKSQRITASTGDEQTNSDLKEDDFPLTTFPAPQVLPGDCLDSDSFEVKARGQSFGRWLTLVKGARNPPVSQRRTVYVMPPPTIDDSVKVLKSWKEPKVPKGKRGDVAVQPAVDEVMQYAQAFFSPVPVKLLPSYEFTNWASESQPRDQKKRKVSAKNTASAKVPEIGLVDPSTNVATRIDTRPGKKQPFARQLSTNNVIDAMIPSVPKDAFAVIMLLEHDLYEDQDDDFIIGRAYGGSRVAVVSMARYNTYLDEVQNIPTDHSWPLTYCADFVKAQELKVPKSALVRLNPKAKTNPAPVLAALRYELENKSKDPSKTWLFRVCRTAVHEALHCFGVGHCIYYGCIMQSTAHAAEDARQPAYLCPVDLAKILYVTGCEESKWCTEMANACLALGPEGGFGALAAWTSARAAQLKEL